MDAFHPCLPPPPTLRLKLPVTIRSPELGLRSEPRGRCRSSHISAHQLDRPAIDQSVPPECDSLVGSLLYHPRWWALPFYPEMGIFGYFVASSVSTNRASAYFRGSLLGRRRPRLRSILPKNSCLIGSRLPGKTFVSVWGRWCLRHLGIASRDAFGPKALRCTFPWEWLDDLGIIPLLPSETSRKRPQGAFPPSCPPKRSCKSLIASCLLCTFTISFPSPKGFDWAIPG